jgi:hypothetical protein
VKYAWQGKGKKIEVPCSKQKNFNVLGFLNGLIANLNLMFLMKLSIQMLSLLVSMSFQKSLINPPLF